MPTFHFVIESANSGVPVSSLRLNNDRVDQTHER